MFQFAEGMVTPSGVCGARNLPSMLRLRTQPEAAAAYLLFSCGQLKTQGW
jgi:hypothetical protein